MQKFSWKKTQVWTIPLAQWFWNFQFPPPLDTLSHWLTVSLRSQVLCAHGMSPSLLVPGTQASLPGHLHSWSGELITWILWIIVATCVGFISHQKFLLGLPWWRTGGESACQCIRRHGFNPWSEKISHTTDHLDPCTTTLEPMYRNYWSPRALSLCSATREATTVRKLQPQLERGRCLPQLEESPRSSGGPAQPTQVLINATLKKSFLLWPENLHLTSWVRKCQWDYWYLEENLAVNSGETF